MRWLLTLALVAVISGSGLASGTDIGFSIRNGSNGNFMAHIGFYLDGYPIDFRSQLVFGSPEGVFITGEVLHTFPAFLFLRPYIAGGLAMGLTAYTTANELRIRFGERFYAIGTVGVQFPARGYQPYLEISQYIGSENFQRVTVGFIVEQNLRFW